MSMGENAPRILHHTNLTNGKQEIKNKKYYQSDSKRGRELIKVAKNNVVTMIRQTRCD